MGREGLAGGEGGVSVVIFGKRRSESRQRPGLRGVFGGLAVVLAVTACDDRVLDHGVTYQHAKGELFGFEPAPEPAPSPIRRMSGVDPEYPSLYTVPMRPPPPATPAERQAAADKLSADRAANRLADAALQEVAPPPLPVPPAPVGVGSVGGKVAKPAKGAVPPGL